MSVAIFSRKSLMQNGDDWKRLWMCALILCRAAKILCYEASLEKSTNFNLKCVYYTESGSRGVSYKQ